MPTYKLIYFNFDGLGEHIRWIFKVAGVEFEEERISFKDWPALKNSGRFPLGSLPVLEIDGVAYTQSDAIIKYLGTVFGMTSDDPLVAFRLDQVLSTLADLRASTKPLFETQDPAEQEKIKKRLREEIMPKIYTHIEDIIRASGGPFIAGSKLTYADLTLAQHLLLGAKGTGFDFKDYKVVSNVRDKVLALPQIDAWMKTRGPYEH